MVLWMNGELLAIDLIVTFCFVSVYQRPKVAAPGLDPAIHEFSVSPQHDAQVVLVGDWKDVPDMEDTDKLVCPKPRTGWAQPVEWKQMFRFRQNEKCSCWYELAL